MAISFVIPTWFIWAYLAAGVLAAAHSWVVEFWRQSTDPWEVMRHRTFWVRMPIVTVAIVLVAGTPRGGPCRGTEGESTNDPF